MEPLDIRLLMALDGQVPVPALDGAVPYADPGLSPAVGPVQPQDRDGGDRGSRKHLPEDWPGQGWGVVVAAGDEPLLEPLRPLLDLREQVQGRRYRPLVVPPGLRAPALNTWVARQFRPGAEVNPNLPRYLLLVGPPDRLPWAVDVELGARGLFPGRLPLDDSKALTAYAHKLVAQEQAQAPGRCLVQVGAALDAPDQPSGRSAALELAEEALVRPLLEHLTQSAPDLELCALVDTLTDPDALLQAAAQAGVLLTVNHGLGVKSGGAAYQRDHQGAPSFLREGSIQPGQLARGAFVPGGVWLSWSCFGAGTPAESVYSVWFKALEQQARAQGAEGTGLLNQLLQLRGTLPQDGRAFACRAAQDALANPEGPVGVFAPTDMAFAYTWTGELASCAPYGNLLADLAAGKPLGCARDHITRIGHSARQDFFVQTGQPGGPLELRAAAALRTLDSAAFVLLGDPAARMPRPKAQEKPRLGWAGRGLGAKSGESGVY